MARSYSVQRAIDESPQRVWELLRRTEGYADWNPAVVSARGVIADGEKIELVAAVSPGRTFKLAVSEESFAQFGDGLKAAAEAKG